MRSSLHLYKAPTQEDFPLTKKLLEIDLLRGQTAEKRRTTILQPVEQKTHSQKDRQVEKAVGYVPDEGTR